MRLFVFFVGAPKRLVVGPTLVDAGESAIHNILGAPTKNPEAALT